MAGLYRRPASRLSSHSSYAMRSSRNCISEPQAAATFGQYSTFARNWDALVYSDNLVMVKAVGNDRNDTGAGHPHDG